ncbi:MAG: translation initiation factor eIF-1A [Nanoarchaeota archaeon]|nr:translation initiation factor eIF-1A [Nanoarchaeota archaeon]
MPAAKKREEQKKQEDIEQEIVRVKLPRGIQVLGVLERRLGGSRCSIRCLDGKTRICRIPGRLKRRLWVREGDIVLIEPWELNADTKGDIIYKYTRAQISHLKKKGLLSKLDEFEQF